MIRKVKMSQSIEHLKHSVECSGIKKRQLANIINNVWHASQQSGSWANDISDAFMHLSQSFNYGRMRCEEYRSVAETIPSLTNAIAKELTKVNGITLEKAKMNIRKLVDSGEVTREVMIAAFESMQNA